MATKNCSFDVQSINSEIKKIKSLLSKPKTFEEGKNEFITLHSKFYSSEMSQNKAETYQDMLLSNLSDYIARTAVNEKRRTILYGLWHSTRIEDITMNMLVCHSKQIYQSNNFKKKINAGIDHTGNSLSEEEILGMSIRIDMQALLKYRLSVGKQSQKIISTLNFGDLKRRVLKEDIERIRVEGAVDDVPSANWLLKFWGNKTVEGILFMPACRHQVVHFNENFRAKEKGMKTLKSKE
jgi:hypothetical protein